VTLKILPLIALGLLLFINTTFASSKGWAYQQASDQMTGEITKIASITSDNVLSFPFPYDQPDDYATLSLFKIGTTGQQIGISVRSGQFSCDELSYDTVEVKFDEHPSVNVRCESAGNGRYDVIYLDTNVRPLVARIRSSSRVIIQAEFFGIGRAQMVFSTRGLDW
jgi:hypothetical protein